MDPRKEDYGCGSSLPRNPKPAAIDTISISSQAYCAREWNGASYGLAM